MLTPEERAVELDHEEALELVRRQEANCSPEFLAWADRMVPKMSEEDQAEILALRAAYTALYQSRRERKKEISRRLQAFARDVRGLTSEEIQRRLLASEAIGQRLAAVERLEADNARLRGLIAAFTLEGKGR